MRYFFGDSASAVDLDRIVGHANDLHTITRSTVPLLAWWRAHGDRHAMSEQMPDDAEARFEFPVASGCAQCGGRGKDSFTDVMLSTVASVIAFEAKYTESRYPDVAKWKRAGSSQDNRKNVLASNRLGMRRCRNPEARRRDVRRVRRRQAARRHLCEGSGRGCSRPRSGTSADLHAAARPDAARTRLRSARATLRRARLAGRSAGAAQ